MRSLIVLTAVLLAGAPAFGSKYSKELPRFEAGLGGGTFKISHYPGSDQSMIRTLFVPYFIYRGDIVQVDRQGRLIMDFLESDRFDVDLSVAGAFSSSAAQNEARKGMDDLDWIGEVGPRLVVHLRPAKKGQGLIDLNLPLRWIFSTDFGRVDHRGFSFTPSVVYRYDGFIKKENVFVSSFSMTFATEALMDYFYEVPEHHATVERPIFDAKGGYLSSSVLVGIGHRYSKKLLLFAGTQVTNYDGTENAESSLMRANWNYTFGLGLSWQFYASEKKVRSSWKTEVY